MDIKILDSWLRDYLHTDVQPDEIARALSLTSASIEKIEPFGKNDFVYHVEVTTNRPDLASVVGFAREAGAVLPRFEIQAKFISPIRHSGKRSGNEAHPESGRDAGQASITIVNDPTLVRRICCVILEVKIAASPNFIKERLEASSTRSINNLVDITNYVMHEMGHPTHAFDYDKLISKKFIIRPSKKGEKIITLDNKEHTLYGGGIVADDGRGNIIDLLGVMGTKNSAVSETTKRIVFFIDNNDPVRIRKTSMSLAIRTEAAGLNEKNVDPELAMPTLVRGIELYQKYAHAKIISDIIDIYPHKPKIKTVVVEKEKINTVVGIHIPVKQSIYILQTLGFSVKEKGETLKVTIPSWRNNDIEIAEDIIEEIARIFGYHNIPSELPPFTLAKPFHETNIFFWEERAKDAMKYWGFTETYTYSFVSEKLIAASKHNAITLANPLDNEHVFMRTTVLPSLLEIIKENSGRDEIKIFELTNVYQKKPDDLPDEIKTLSAIWKGNNVSFYQMKGIVEQLANDLGIHELAFEDLEEGIGSSVILASEERTHPESQNDLQKRGDAGQASMTKRITHLGKIEILENNLIAFELNFDELAKYATLKKTYTPISKFPPVIEDMALVVDTKIKTGDIIMEIKKQSPLIKDVSLLDQFENTRTFHIVYQDKEKNLTGEEVKEVREKILKILSRTFSAKLKE